MMKQTQVIQQNKIYIDLFKPNRSLIFLERSYYGKIRKEKNEEEEVINFATEKRTCKSK
jgi:hypothetical protein